MYQTFIFSNPFVLLMCMGMGIVVSERVTRKAIMMIGWDLFD